MLFLDDANRINVTIKMNHHSLLQVGRITSLFMSNAVRGLLPTYTRPTSAWMLPGPLLPTFRFSATAFPKMCYVKQCVRLLTTLNSVKSVFNMFVTKHGDSGRKRDRDGV